MSRASTPAAAALLLTLGAVGPASAASVDCVGAMRNPGCETAPDEYRWPANSQPTFSVECETCPGPNDAGLGCTPLAPDPTRFAVTAGTRTHAQPRYFQEIGKCGNEVLYRYGGPIEPGMRHGIDFGVADRPLATLHFEVATLPLDAAPTADAGPRVRPDAGADAGRTSSSGGGCALGRHTDGRALPILIAALALTIRWRRRR